jgi:hypothetical protein
MKLFSIQASKEVTFNNFYTIGHLRENNQPTTTLISIASETFKGNIREMAMYDLIRAAVVLGQENTNTTLEAYLQYASDSFKRIRHQEFSTTNTG